MVIEDAARVSANTDGWVGADYLEHWCRVGLPEYLKLREFCESKKWLPFNRAMTLCFKGTLGGNAKTATLYHDFARGKYQANNMEQAERICTMALNFKSWVPFWKEGTFMAALRNLDNNKDYDHARMMARMQSQSTKLVRCSNATDYIAVMNIIYNFRSTEPNKVTLTKINNASSKWRE